MTQEIFPEIQSATEALQKRISLTEAEIAQMKDDLKTKKAQVKAWRKALTAFSPVVSTRKHKATVA